jgi:hypothetical protein
MKKISKFWIVCASMTMCVLSNYVSAWSFYSDVDSDSSSWSRYYNFKTDPAGADRYTDTYNNMFVRIWADKNAWSSAGRTVSLPFVNYCTAQITHTGSAGVFYVRDSASYTNLSPIVNVSRSNYWPDNPKSVLPKVATNFSAWGSRKVFARFYMEGGIENFTGQYGPVYVKKTAYIDDLLIICF